LRGFNLFRRATAGQAPRLITVAEMALREGWAVALTPRTRICRAKAIHA
jgi:hypothetical protein